MRLTCHLTLLALCACHETPKIIITENYVELHSSKPFANFFTNLNYAQLFLQSIPFADSTHCFSPLKATINESLTLSSNFLSPLRSRRSIKPLGDLLGWITGVPSPTEWDRERSIVQKLTEVVKSESNDIQSLERLSTIETNEINTLESTLKDLATQESSNMHTLEQQIKQSNSETMKATLCLNSLIIENQLSKEISTFNSIRQNARFNLPPPELFPKDKVLAAMNRHATANDLKLPLFNKKDDLEILFSMNIAITSMNANSFHSLMSIPLVESDDMAEINHISPDTNSFTRLHEIELLTKINIDLALCLPKKPYNRLFSTQFMHKCSKTLSHNFHVCRGRSIQLALQPPFTCKINPIPKLIALEIDHNTFFIEKNNATFYMTCPKSTKEFKIASNSKIFLPPNCSLKSDDININAAPIASNFDNSALLNDTIIISDYDLIDIKLPKSPPINNSFHDILLQNHSEKITKLALDMHEITQLHHSLQASHDKEKQLLNEKIEKVQGDITPPLIISGTAIGIGIFMLLGLIIILIMIKNNGN